MGWFEGLLTGYVDRHHELLDEQFKEEQAARQREAQVYRDLLNSQDDETYHLAATGLLNMTQPGKRASGMRGWMGEMQKNPIYGRLQQYMNTPQFRQGRRIPVPGGQLPTPPAPTGSAAMPATPSAVEGGQITPPQPAPQTQAPQQPPNPTAVLPGGQSPWLQGGPRPWDVVGPNPAPSAPQLPASPYGPLAAQATPQPPPPDPTAILPGGQSPFLQGGRPPWQVVPPPPPTTEDLFRRPRPVPALPAGVDPSVVAAQGTGAVPVPRFAASTAAPVSSDVAFAPTPPPAPEPTPPAPQPPPAPPAAAAAQPPPAPPPMQQQFIQEPGDWHRPHSFPTAGDVAALASGGALTGQYRAYYQMHLAEGLDEMAARQAAVDDVLGMHLRGGSRSAAAGNQPMELDLTYPDGRQDRILGWADKINQRYLYEDGQPIPQQVRVDKAVPYSALSGSVYSREAARILNVHPGNRDPVKAAQVTALANQLRGDASFASRTGTLEANASGPIDPVKAIEYNLPIGATWQDYRTMKLATPEQIEKVRSIISLKTQLGHIRGLLGDALPSDTELQGLAPNLAAAVRERTTRRDEFARVRAAVDAVLMVFARSVAEQKGAQTEQDAVRAYNSIVQLQAGLRQSLLDPFGGDTQESANARIDESMTFLDIAALKMTRGAPNLPQDPNAPNRPPAPPPAAAAPAAPATPTAPGGVPGGTGAKWNPATGRFEVK